MDNFYDEFIVFLELEHLLPFILFINKGAVSIFVKHEKRHDHF